MVGQFVEVQLDPAQLPALVATAVDVKNFNNEVDVEVDDDSGEPVDDSGDDIEVDVTETVSVQSPAPSAPAMHRVKKVLHFHTTAAGHVVLSGLPTGHAKITVTRGVSSARRRVTVRANTMRSIRMRLRTPRSSS